jgi:hypothetical protein
VDAAEEDGARLAADTVVVPTGQKASKQVPHSAALAQRPGKSGADYKLGPFRAEICD